MLPDEVFIEMKRCKEDPYYFYLKYMRIKGTDNQMYKPEVKEIDFYAALDAFQTKIIQDSIKKALTVE
jgi:hypothetical protein